MAGPAKPTGVQFLDNMSPLCINQKCTIRLGCEHAQERPTEGMREVVDYHKGANFNDCDNFVQRRELNTQGQVPTTSRKRRHNAHAPERKGRPNLFADPKNVDLRKFGLGVVDLTKPNALGPKIGQNGELPQSPDLNVSRHIRKGKDIKKDEQ